MKSKERIIIEKVCRSVRRKILKEEGTSENQCTYASGVIYDRLKELGIKVKVRDGKFAIDKKRYGQITRMPHTWVEWKGIPIDVTADQFNPYLKAKNRVKAIVFGTHKDRFRRYQGQNFY